MEKYLNKLLYCFSLFNNKDFLYNRNCIEKLLNRKSQVLFARVSRLFILYVQFIRWRHSWLVPQLLAICSRSISISCCCSSQSRLNFSASREFHSKLQLSKLFSRNIARDVCSVDWTSHDLSVTRNSAQNDLLTIIRVLIESG